MEAYSAHLTKLMEELSALPGIGKKSAERMAFYLVGLQPERVKRLTDAITGARENIRYCSVCQNLSDSDICPICADPGRDGKKIMVVETPRDLAAYEKTGRYEGVYHVLHGSISPMLGIGPKDIRLKELIVRLEKEVE